jgi:hypothetical protein
MSESKRYTKAELTAILTPSRSSPNFQCPHCHIFAKQDWASVFYSDGFAEMEVLECAGRHVMVAHCQACERPSIWLVEEMLYPDASTAPMPAEDMPEEVKADYMEARSVFDKSARSAGGLLRLAFDKLFPHLGVTKSDPNSAIAELVKKGLVLGDQQKALDVMRIFANQSAHNGFVKLEDQPATVAFLFDLLNQIVEQMITRPKQLDAMFKLIPQDKLDAIAKRDGMK